MWRCYFRLFVVFEITIFKMPWSELLKSTLCFVTKKYFFSRVLFTFYSSSFPAKYFLLVLRYFFQVLFYFVTKYWNKVTTPALVRSDLDLKNCCVIQFNNGKVCQKQHFMIGIKVTGSSRTAVCCSPKVVQFFDRPLMAWSLCTPVFFMDACVAKEQRRPKR